MLHWPLCVPCDRHRVQRETRELRSPALKPLMGNACTLFVFRLSLEIEVKRPPHSSLTAATPSVTAAAPRGELALVATGLPLHLAHVEVLPVPVNSTHVSCSVAPPRGATVAKRLRQDYHIMTFCIRQRSMPVRRHLDDARLSTLHGNQQPCHHVLQPLQS